MVRENQFKKFTKLMITISSMMVIFGLAIGCNAYAIQSYMNTGIIGVAEMELCFQSAQIAFFGFTLVWLGINVITVTVFLYGGSIYLQSVKK